MKSRKRLILLILVFSIVAFAESSIPFVYAKKKCKPDEVFLGVIRNSYDQNMYFSFIRQAFDGKWIFYNRLTSTPNNGVFINLEFLLIGKIQRIFSLSESEVYQIWRCLSVLLVTNAFFLLALFIYGDIRKVVFSAIIFLFTGGLGFLYMLLHIIKLVPLNYYDASRTFNAVSNGLTIDIATHRMPFTEFMANPNLSFPIGVLLFGFYFYLIADRRCDIKFYLLAGAVFVSVGLMRPYDIIPIFVFLPLYLLVTCRKEDFRFKPILIRLIPVFMLLPVLVYNIWLYNFNEIFKYWSSQGNTSSMIPNFFVDYFNYGIVSVLAFLRIIQFRKNPFDKSEKFMLVMFVVTLLFIHSGNYLPFMRWSYQIGVYAMAPLVLIGCNLNVRHLNFNNQYRTIGVCFVVLIVLVSNVTTVIWNCKLIEMPVYNSSIYAKQKELQAWRWLDKNTKSNEVVLATPFTSALITKYTSLNVVAGHITVTPKFTKTKNIIKALLSDSVLNKEQRPVLEQLNADYIYIGKYERMLNNIVVDTSDYLKTVYSNSLISIYKVGRGGKN